MTPSTAKIFRRQCLAPDRSMAELLGRRHAWHGATALYRATIAPDAILAYLDRRGEGWTIVVDPAGICEIERETNVRAGGTHQLP